MTMKKIMQEAHRRAKTYEGDYSARLALAMREIYREIRQAEAQERALKEQKEKFNTFVYEVTENALKSVLNGKGRNKFDGHSALDNINDLSFLFQNGYKYDHANGYTDGSIITKLDGDIFNACFEECYKVCSNKDFQYVGQAVNYMAYRFTRMIYTEYTKYKEGKTTKAMQLESTASLSHSDTREILEKENESLRHNDVADMVGWLDLDRELQDCFTEKQLSVIQALAEGKTHRQIAQEGIASNRTVQKVKARLYPLLKSRIA